MHPFYQPAASITSDVIGAAIEVHRTLGPGLLESIYEWSLTVELELRGHTVVSQKNVVVSYKGFERLEWLKFDLLVDGCLLIEIKVVEALHPVFKAQLLSYMKLLDVPIGLLMNFRTQRLVDGVSRLILRGADADETSE